MPQQPSSTVVPNRQTMDAIVKDLLDAREIFTAERSQTQQGVWHVGVMQPGAERINFILGRTRDIGTVGDCRLTDR